MINCAIIQQELSKLDVCESSENGVRISTDCLYPSFNRVFVHIVKSGDGYLVHDGAGAAVCAWDHGREVARLNKLWDKVARRYDCSNDHFRLIAKAPSSEWLLSAVVSVANASAVVANLVLDRDANHDEISLSDRIAITLERSPQRIQFERNKVVRGASGRSYEFEFCLVRTGIITTLIDTVTPHHNSIAAKYVAFDDTPPRPQLNKFLVYERELLQTDKILMQNVADLIHISMVERSFGAAFVGQ